MAVFRIEKNKNYTSMANYHFYDKSLSWKAKGILSNMLSLPDDWDYSLAGLATLSSDGISATRSAIKELEEHKYLIRRPIRKDGKICDWEYLIFEKPQEENLLVENLLVENHNVDRQTFPVTFLFLFETVEPALNLFRQGTHKSHFPNEQSCFRLLF